MVTDFGNPRLTSSDTRKGMKETPVDVHFIGQLKKDMKITNNYIIRVEIII